MLRPKNTTIRRHTRAMMKEKLAKGLNYGRGLDFFHISKAKLKEGRRGEY